MEKNCITRIIQKLTYSILLFIYTMLWTAAFVVAMISVAALTQGSEAFTYLMLLTYIALMALLFRLAEKKSIEISNRLMSKGIPIAVGDGYIVLMLDKMDQFLPRLKIWSDCKYEIVEPDLEATEQATQYQA